MIGDMMPTMAKAAVLSGHFTNDSVRRTMCTQLFQAVVPLNMITLLSRHKIITMWWLVFRSRNKCVGLPMGAPVRSPGHPFPGCQVIRSSGHITQGHKSLKLN